MTITETDWQSEIDAAPRGDAAVRFAYADWLEEQGDADGARFQRWMGEWRRAAHQYVDGRWSWMSRGWTVVSTSDELPIDLYSRCANMHPTRIAAENALRAALESVDYEVT